MKTFIRQCAVILCLSIVTGLVYNHFSKSPLPIFKAYDAHEATVASATKGEDMPKVEINDIDAETMQALVESGGAVLLDARTTADYDFEHIPNAVSLPISEFEALYPSVKPLLEEGKTIIVYCEGHNCTDSTMLTVRLFKEGFQDIFVYKGGMEEWLQQGYPIESGPRDDDAPQS